MDRISELPDVIVHHILSSLNISAAELVRMSILSKTWFHLTASFPILNFHNNGLISRETFFKYVEYATSRFCDQNLTAHKFKLITTLAEPAEVDVVNRCLGLVLKNGVRNLVIDTTNSEETSHVSVVPPMQMYRLPNILLSASMLKSLTIRGCDLPSSLMVDVVKFKSLIHLKLYKVHVDDEVIKSLTTSCPLLQVLRVIECRGFKCFCVYGHQNLKEVYIHFNTPLERIDIEAPNLYHLVLLDVFYGGAPAMNVASCKKLTTVTYCGHPSLDSNGLTDFLSNFPFVELLFYATRYKENNLKLSSHSLRTLMLCSNYELEDVEFNFPNLKTFNFMNIDRLAASPMKIGWLRPLLEHSMVTTHVKSSMICYPHENIDALWFQKLRLFLDKKNGFKVSNFYIHPILSQKFKELEKLKAIKFPPYELEHFELKVDTHGDFSALIDFIDAVLWCFRPRSITLGSFFDLTNFEDVFKFTYKKLLEQEYEGHTKVRIVLPSSSEVQKDCMGMKSLLTAFPCEGKTISFIKEEVTIPERKWKKVQESARKDVERAFGVLKARWGIINRPARQTTKERMMSIMYACMILHNMILKLDCRAISPNWVQDPPTNVPDVYVEALLNEITDHQAHFCLKFDLETHVDQELDIELNN